MKNQVRILVTGAGALLGQGILRCLNSSQNDYYIITADPDIKSSGHALGNKAYRIPLAKSDNYLDAIERIFSKEKLDIVLLGTDVELPIFSLHQDYLQGKYDLKIVISPANIIRIANNKWLTAEFLRKHNFPYPLSTLTADEEGIENLIKFDSYPYIAKPVDGARSKGLKIIENKSQLQKLTTYTNNLVVQEMIGDEEGEFTTGCTVLNGKCVAVVSLVRELRDGNTWRAYRKDNSPYDNTIAKIAETLGCEGPVNFQYRIRNGEPVIFEINCRFSGTTPLRLIYGFNEVEAIVEFYVNNTSVIPPKLKTGTILRTFSDVLIGNEDLENFDRDGVLVGLKSTYVPFKITK
ncbi:MAG: ATP-grasp domain-containing protein [Nonlabens sp.]